MTRVSEWRVRALYVARRVLFLLCARRDALIGDDLDCFVGNRVGEESRVGSAHLCACLEGSFSALLLFTVRLTPDNVGPGSGRPIVAHFRSFKVFSKSKLTRLQSR